MTYSAVLVLISLFISSNAQTCSNADLEQFVELEKNATNEAKNEILSVVLGGGSLGGTTVADGTGVNDTTLYSTIASSLNITVVEQSEDQLNNFTQALDVITDSYFKACYGPLEERPSISDTPQLITELLTLLNNETNYARSRELYGQLLCLQESSNTTESGGVSKRQIDPVCFDAQDLASLYNCIDPRSISCIFQFEFCPDKSNVGGQSFFPLLSRNCLAFVVDTTGSMGDEIVATRQVIADFISGEENIHTACYILVAYNDFGDTTNLENNLEFARVYSADSLNDDNGLIEVDDGQQVFGLTRLLQDVNGLMANGGGDCPEYGMIGIQKAMDLLRGINIVEDAFSEGNFPLRKHNIVVLTDASAKDNYLAESIIMNLQEFLPSTEVHFFFSGSGCNGGFGNFTDISTATNGINVKQIDANAFQEFVDFIQLGANRFTKRRRRSTSTCRSFIITQFIFEFTILARTNQNSVILTSPNGTLTVFNTADKDFVIHTESDPEAGTWQACVTAPGTLETSLATKVNLDFSVDYLTKDSSGLLLPSNNLPFICSRRSFTIEIAQLDLISLNHSLYLDFVDQDRNILSSAEITECRGILSGTMNISTQNIVEYQLRGHDTSGNEFAHVRPNSGLVSLLSSETGFSVSSSDIIINPDELSLVRLLVTNILAEPYQNVDFEVHVPSEVNITLLSETHFNMIQPRETRSIQLGLSTELSEGSSFNIILSINDYCIVTNVTLPALVRPFVHVTLINRTIDSLTFTWAQSYNSISKYVISYETVSGITSITVDNSTLMYTIDNLTPYDLVYFSVIAKTSDDSTVAGSVSQPFRTEESIPSSVDRIQIDIVSSTSARLSWSEPADKNGIILYYEVTVTSLNSDESYSKTFTVNATISNPELTLMLRDLNQYSRYEVEVRAATIAGKSEPLVRQFYTSEGVPSHGPSTIKYNVISNNLVQVTWDPPVIDNRRGFITGYSIELLIYSDDATTESIETFTVGKNTFVYELPMLDSYKRYEVVIRARTSAGLGQRNSTIFYTQEGAPLASTSSFNYTIISATSFLLAWNAPGVNQRRGFLTHYTVSVVNSRESLLTKRDTRREKTYQISHDTTELLIEDLTQFGSYSVSVSATTSAGTGPPTTLQLDIVTGVPSAPTNVSVSQINNTAVILQWGYPTEVNGRIEEFIVFYSYQRSEGEDTGKYSNKSVIQVSTPSNESVITDLISGKQYMLEIAARNPAGIGSTATVHISLVSETSATGSNSAAVAASVSVVLVIIVIACVAVVIAIAIFLTFRQKRKTEKIRNSDIPLPVKAEKA